MHRNINALILIIFSIAIISCGKDTENLKTIQKQTVGDYIVSLSNSSGNISKGNGIFYIEFRSVNGDQLTDAGKISASAIMNMQGMPMSVDIPVTPTDKNGRYEAKYNLSMSGTWILEVNFDGEKKAQFSLIVN